MHITDHADNRHPLAAIEPAHNAMPDGIAIWKALPGQLLADDRYKGLVIDIAIAEVAPSQKGKTPRLEVIRTRQAKAGIRLLAQVIGRSLPALDSEVAT